MMSPTDKCGGNRHPPSLLHVFHDVIDQCRLVEVNTIGNHYTWEKSRGSSRFLEEKLDWAFANTSWLDLFVEAKGVHEDAHCPDHCALSLTIS
ncbi:hypothetical protein M5689_011101 [Euphorbia peplus]|nr:hypothetical protein M5689_011101 [Euphorbia peplus]